MKMSQDYDFIMSSREFTNFHKLGASPTLEGQTGEKLKIAGCS